MPGGKCWVSPVPGVRHEGVGNCPWRSVDHAHYCLSRERSPHLTAAASTSQHATHSHSFHAAPPALRDTSIFCVICWALLWLPLVKLSSSSCRYTDAIPFRNDQAQRLMEGYSSGPQRSSSAPSGGGQEANTQLPVSLRIAIVRARVRGARAGQSSWLCLSPRASRGRPVRNSLDAASVVLLCGSGLQCAQIV